MTKVYVSGPISGKPFAYLNFNDTENALVKKGYEVFNPISLSLPTHLDEEREYEKVGDWAYFMRRGVEGLAKCNYLLALEGWDTSRGAKIEISLAKDLKIPVFFTVEELEEYKENDLRKS